MALLLQTVLLALITGSGPVLAIWLTGRQRREEALATWGRQDAVAAAVRQESAAQRKSQQAIAEEAHSTSVRLDLVHKLVNNTLTMEKERALLLTRRSIRGAQVNKALLVELGRDREAAEIGIDIEEMVDEINQLEAELADRARQVESARSEIAETEANPM